jgi:hypothetical protein
MWGLFAHILIKQNLSTWFDMMSVGSNNKARSSLLHTYEILYNQNSRAEKESRRVYAAVEKAHKQDLYKYVASDEGLVQWIYTHLSGQCIAHPNYTDRKLTCENSKMKRSMATHLCSLKTQVHFFLRTSPRGKEAASLCKYNAQFKKHSTYCLLKFPHKSSSRKTGTSHSSDTKMALI